MSSDSNVTAGDTPARILESASERFAQSGFNGIGTREIGLKAKVNEVTTYRPFRSKRALCVAVLEFELRRIPLRGDLLEQLAESPDGQTALGWTVQAFIACLSSLPNLIRLIQFSARELGEDTDALLHKHLGHFPGVLSKCPDPWIVRDKSSKRRSKPLVLSLGRLLPETAGGPSEILKEVANLLGVSTARGDWAGVYEGARV